jgi:hypothetical protein
MQRITTYLLCAGLFAPVLTAQAGPGMTDADPGTAGHQAMVKSVYLSSVDNAATTLWDVTPKIWSTSGRNITQVHLGKGSLGLGAKDYHMALTTSTLSTAWTTGAGGVAGSGDVIMGKLSYATGTPVFTPQTTAALMNSTGNDFGLMISADGTRAAIDWPAGPMWSMRTIAIPITQFPKPVAVTGISGTYVDPAPGKIGGVLGIFWVSGGTQISWAPVKETITAGKLTAAAIVTAGQIAAITSTNQPHSPTPVFGTNGNTRGMWYSRVTGSDSDEYYSGQVPDATGGIKVYDSTAWSNNGGVAGSRLICAYSGHYNTLLEGRGSHGGCNSAITVKTGATLDITIHSPTGTPSLFTSTMGVALGVGTPIPLPGILGALGLDASKILIITGGPTGLTGDTAELSLPASDSGLKGLTLHLQFVTSPTSGFGPAFTNTMSPSFK